MKGQFRILSPSVGFVVSIITSPVDFFELISAIVSRTDGFTDSFHVIIDILHKGLYVSSPRAADAMPAWKPIGPDPLIPFVNWYRSTAVELVNVFASVGAFVTPIKLASPEGAASVTI